MDLQRLSLQHFAKEVKGFRSKIAHYVEHNHLTDTSTKGRWGRAANQDFGRVRHGLVTLMTRYPQKEIVGAPAQSFAPKVQHRDV